MSVQVGFSDPTLRALAHENLQRLEAALRQQYDTAVDLQLDQGPAGDTPGGDQGSPHPGYGGAAADTPAETATTSAPRRAGARHVWVG
ncbi:MAG: hypothetical protein KatS3mg044_0091 [Rhodothermaceae bacterium]|nr:MAG: hypothetical protein KatS3mg044_0091 [Rhodothermaceae bacterium]